jgi:hypothetical protein
MNKNFFLVLIALLATFVAQAHLRITNNSDSIIYLFNQSKRAIDRAMFVEIAPTKESYRTMNRDELKRYSYLHKGSFNGIHWVEININGKATFRQLNVDTKESAVVAHLDIKSNGNVVYKGKNMKAYTIPLDQKFIIMKSV